jgi:hypothetical protein
VLTSVGEGREGHCPEAGGRVNYPKLAADKASLPRATPRYHSCRALSARLALAAVRGSLRTALTMPVQLTLDFGARWLGVLASDALSVDNHT